MVIAGRVKMVDVVEAFRDLAIALPTFGTQVTGTGTDAIGGNLFVLGVFGCFRLIIEHSFLFVCRDQDVDVIE